MEYAVLQQSTCYPNTSMLSFMTFTFCSHGYTSASSVWYPLVTWCAVPRSPAFGAWPPSHISPPPAETRSDAFSSPEPGACLLNSTHGKTYHHPAYIKALRTFNYQRPYTVSTIYYCITKQFSGFHLPSMKFVFTLWYTGNLTYNVFTP